jgi:hypothetical protein
VTGLAARLRPAGATGSFDRRVDRADGARGDPQPGQLVDDRGLAGADRGGVRGTAGRDRLAGVRALPRHRYRPAGRRQAGRPVRRPAGLPGRHRARRRHRHARAESRHAHRGQGDPRLRHLRRLPGGDDADPPGGRADRDRQPGRDPHPARRLQPDDRGGGPDPRRPAHRPRRLAHDLLGQHPAVAGLPRPRRAAVAADPAGGPSPVHCGHPRDGAVRRDAHRPAAVPHGPAGRPLVAAAAHRRGGGRVRGPRAARRRPVPGPAGARQQRPADGHVWAER